MLWCPIDTSMVSAAAKDVEKRSPAAARTIRLAIIESSLLIAMAEIALSCGFGSNVSSFAPSLDRLGCTANRDWRSRSISCPKKGAAQSLSDHRRKSVHGEQKNLIHGHPGCRPARRAGERRSAISGRG